MVILNYFRLFLPISPYVTFGYFKLFLLYYKFHLKIFSAIVNFFGYFMLFFTIVNYFTLGVTTLALGSRPRQGFARVRAK
jgi:hypothetical protein